MNSHEEEKVLYMEDVNSFGDPENVPVKKRKWKKLKLLNVVMLFLAAYFVFTIARQEFKLREIKAETISANEQLSQLKQEEGIISKKIADASSTHMVENKAKTILGWVKEGETKVLAE